MPASEHSCKVELKTSVWLLQESELYDYQSSYKRSSSFQLAHSSAVYQCGSEVVVLPLDAQVPVGAEKLAVIFVHEDSALVVNAQSMQNEDCAAKSMWLVASQMKFGRRSGCQLREGDVIRLANREWAVTEISAGQSSQPQCISAQLQETPADAQCKICLGYESSPEDPLVAPCNCKGSVRYLHVGCLDHWLASKLRHQDQHYRSRYRSPSLDCGLCGKTLPLNLEVNGRHFHNLGVSKPRDRYVVLRDPANNEVQLWHWDDCRELGLGSGGENEIMLEGLSYRHAKVVFKGSQLRLRDRNSRFGSLVLVQKPLMLTRGDFAAVQCGNVLLRINLKKSGFFGCFGSQRKSVSYADLEQDVV